MHDGSGVADDLLMRTQAGQTQVYTLAPSGFALDLAQAWELPNSPTAGFDQSLADINGDNQVELLSDLGHPKPTEEAERTCQISDLLRNLRTDTCPQDDDRMSGLLSIVSVKQYRPMKKIFQIFQIGVPSLHCLVHYHLRRQSKQLPPHYHNCWQNCGAKLMQIFRIFTEQDNLSLYRDAGE